MTDERDWKTLESAPIVLPVPPSTETFADLAARKEAAMADGVRRTLTREFLEDESGSEQP